MAYTRVFIIFKDINIQILVAVQHRDSFRSIIVIVIVIVIALVNTNAITVTNLKVH